MKRQREQYVSNNETTFSSITPINKEEYRKRLNKRMIGIIIANFIVLSIIIWNPNYSMLINNLIRICNSSIITDDSSKVDTVSIVSFTYLMLRQQQQQQPQQSTAKSNQTRIVRHINKNMRSNRGLSQIMLSNLFRNVTTHEEVGEKQQLQLQQLPTINTEYNTTSNSSELSLFNITSIVTTVQIQSSSICNTTPDFTKFDMFRLAQIESLASHNIKENYLQTNETLDIVVIPTYYNGTEYWRMHTISNIPNDFLLKYRELLDIGKLYIIVDPLPICDTRLSKTSIVLTIQANSTIRKTKPRTIRLSGSETSLNTTNDTNTTTVVYNPNTMGVKTIAIIRISTLDSVPTYNAIQIYLGLFGVVNTSVAQQFSDCSFGQLQWKIAENGVIDVLLNTSMSNFQYGSEVINAVEEQLINNGTKKLGPTIDLQSLADKVILMVPPGTGEWVANSGVNFWRAQFNDKWTLSLSAMMHELGHTLGLSHSNEQSMEYGDSTGYMSAAYSSQSWPRKCFNSAHNYQLQWYYKRHRNVTATNLIERSYLIDLATFVDYNITTENEPVIINIANVLFLQYNRAKSFNIDTEEMKDMITIVSGDGIYEGQPGTSLLGGLAIGNRFSIYLHFNNTEIMTNDTNNNESNENNVNPVGNLLKTVTSNNGNNYTNTTLSIGSENNTNYQDPTKADKDSRQSNDVAKQPIWISFNNTDASGIVGNGLLLILEACEGMQGKNGAEIIVLSISLDSESICFQTESPTINPTEIPSSEPTLTPSTIPSFNPTYQQSFIPSYQPSVLPTKSVSPSYSPTSSLTFQPTNKPITSQPNNKPTTIPTITPTLKPTRRPTFHPTRLPTIYPTNVPIRPSNKPTSMPTAYPTLEPTSRPPTLRPTSKPYILPTRTPTGEPRSAPIKRPTKQPTTMPSSTPSVLPSQEPSVTPVRIQSTVPVVDPVTYLPSSAPSMNKTTSPALVPFHVPSLAPTSAATTRPILQPTSVPKLSDIAKPTNIPSSMLSSIEMKDDYPSLMPSTRPSSSVDRDNVSSNILNSSDPWSLLPPVPMDVTSDSVNESNMKRIFLNIASKTESEQQDSSGGKSHEKKFDMDSLFQDNRNISAETQYYYHPIIPYRKKQLFDKLNSVTHKSITSNTTSKDSFPFKYGLVKQESRLIDIFKASYS